ncbi:MAG: ABC transporter permease subunit, partial [Alphaproteobacteria bacterium]|nr:ABC transporter permease subunit [Alphaproteobacteria bacterium]
MTAYIIRRLLFIIPTLFGIMVINFAVVQFAPGGPIEQIIAQVTGTAVDATARISGAGGGDAPQAQAQQGAASAANIESRYRGAQGLDPEFIKDLERQFGFDKPLHTRFIKMIKSYIVFDFGESFYRDRRVVDLVIDKMPVSISLGIWTTLLIYLISIPLGIRKAVRDGTPFDIWTSSLVIVGQAIPGFLFAILLIVVFAGGTYLDWFPLRGLVSENFSDLTLFGKVVDYFHHIALPITALVISGFAGLTLLTKNSFLDQINQQYVLTARAKGLTERQVLYGHVF